MIVDVDVVGDGDGDVVGDARDGDGESFFSRQASAATRAVTRPRANAASSAIECTG